MILGLAACGAAHGEAVNRGQEAAVPSSVVTRLADLAPCDGRESGLDCNLNGIDDGCELADPAYALTANAVFPSGFEDQDIEITLQASGPAGVDFSTVIRSLPASGTLYQYNGGTRGAVIDAAGTSVTDSLQRVIFAPHADVSGVDSATFTYAAENCVRSSEAQVSINLTPVNDPPVLTLPGNITVTAGQTVAIPVSVYDVDAGTEDLRVSLNLYMGVLNLGTTAGLTMLSGDGVDDQYIQFEGTLTGINSALATLTYTADTCQVESPELNVTVEDLGATGTGSSGTSSDWIMIDVKGAPVSYAGFGETQGLSFVGSSFATTGVLHLTSAAPDQAGAVWACTPRPFGHGFSTGFEFRIADQSTEDGAAAGGEGFAFVLQRAGSESLGEGGSGLGFAGIPKSLAVVFDTYDPANPGLNRISIQTRANNPNSTESVYALASADVPFDLSDGQAHNVWIDYTPGSLAVYVDDLSAPLLTAEVNLGAILTGPVIYYDETQGESGLGRAAFVGFTASTGAAHQIHEISSWQFESSEANTAPVANLAGTAMEHDLTGGCVTYSGPNQEFGLGQSFTVEVWARPDSLSPAALLVSKGGIEGTADLGSANPTGNSKVNYQLRQVDGGRLSFRFRNETDTAWNEFRTSATVFVPGRWNHVAASFTFGQADSLRLFVDGEIVAGNWVEGTGNEAPFLLADMPLLTGALLPQTLDPEGQIFSEPFDGAIDELRVWSMARSQEQIREGMNRRLLPPEDGLVSNIRYDDFFLRLLGDLPIGQKAKAGARTGGAAAADFSFPEEPFLVSFPNAADFTGGCASGMYFPTDLVIGGDADLSGGCVHSGADLQSGPYRINDFEDSVRVTLSGKDADGDPLRAAIVSLPEGGRLYQAGTDYDGDTQPDDEITEIGTLVEDPFMRLYYVSNGTHEVDHFHFVVTDGQASSEETTVTILNGNLINDPPVVVTPPRLQVPHGGWIRVNDFSSDGHYLGIVDPDAGSGEMTVTLTADHGTLTLGTTEGLTLTEGDGQYDVRLSFTAPYTSDSQPIIQYALDSLVYHAPDNYVGVATIEVVADDQGNSGSGEAQVRRNSVVIDVTNAKPWASLAGSTIDFTNWIYVSAEDADGTLDRSTSEALTIEAWVETTDSGWYRTILTNGNTTGSQLNYALQMRDGRLAFRFMTADSEFHTYTSDEFVAQLYEWSHVAVSFEFGNPESARLYVNGVHVPGSWTEGTGAGDVVTSEEPVWISTNGNGENFYGKIDEIRVWNVVRTPEEIAEYRNDSLAFADPRLSAYWRLDEGSGFVAADSSPNGNHGVVVEAIEIPRDESGELFMRWVPSGSMLTEVTTLRNTDVPVALAGIDVDGDPMSARVDALPVNGTLFQYAEGGRGDAIGTAGSVVEDWARRVIYAPNQDESGDPLDAFLYTLRDPFADSETTAVVVRVVDPTLRVTQVLVDDFGPGGNGNGLLDPNECASLWVTVENASVTTVTNLQARLTPRSSELAVAAGTSAYPDLDLVTTGTNVSAFQIFSSPELVCTEDGFTLMLEVATDQGVATVPVRLSADQLACPGTAAGCPTPFLVRDSVVPDDSEGNGDGLVDLNERLRLQVDLRNVGSLAATAVSATLVSETPGVQILVPGSPYGDILSGETAANLYPFRLFTTPEFVCGTTVRLRLDVTSAEGVFSFPIELASGTAQEDTVFSGPSNVAIPAGDQAGVLIPIEVSGLTTSIQDVAVSVHVEHPNVGALELSLISPAGTTVMLYSSGQVYGSNLGTDCPADGNDTVFADRATSTITEVEAPYAGVFRPVEPLSVFSGMVNPEANGTWYLRAVNYDVSESTVTCSALSVRSTPLCATIIDEVAPTVQILPVTPNIRNFPVDQIQIEFSEPVLGFGLEDLELSLADGVNRLTGSESLTTTDAQTFILSGLEGLTEAEGVYALNLPAVSSGVTDTAGNALPEDTSGFWLMDTTKPTVDVADVIPTLRSTPVTTLTVVFSEPVVNFDLGEVVLTRNGENILTGNESLVTSDSVTWELGDVSGITADEGEYEFGVVGGLLPVRLGLGVRDIQDRAGNAMLDSDWTIWTVGAVTQVADLQVTQVSDLNPAFLMEPVTFTVTVRNNGPDAADSVTLSNVVPGDVHGVSVALSQGTWSMEGQMIIAEIGTLAPGADATLAVTFTPTSLGEVTNEAVVSSSISQDPVPGNDTSTLTVPVVARVTDVHTENFTETQGAWEPFGILYPKLSYVEYSARSGALKGYIGAAPNRQRVAGWRSLNWNALPYSAIGPDKYVRAKFSIYTGGQAQPATVDQIPGLRLRLAHRFAQTSLLDVFPQQDIDAGNLSAADLRPSDDPDRPSVYRVDMDPIDVPLLQELGDSEGIMMAFEAYSTDPSDYGYIGLSEVQLGTYPSAALPLSEEPVQVYAPTETDAGSLSSTLPEAHVLSQTLVWSGTPGLLPTPAPAEAGTAAHYEGSFGVTLDTTQVAPWAVAYMQREFDPGAPAQRVRVEPGKQYSIRFHVTSTLNTADQAMLYMKARAARFGYVQKTLVGGAWGAGDTNNALAQQMLPGVGSQNPDKDGEENGGWYTVLMYTPLAKEIRAELDQELSIEELMPNLAAEPGPGEAVPSLRDLKIGADVLDTFSSHPNAGLERASFTIDRIEVRVHDAVLD